MLGYETTAEYSEYAEEGMDRRTDITEVVIGAAIDVHRALGPGLLESTYEACLVHELLERGLSLEREKALPVTYRGVLIDCGYRIDLLVENSLIVELKAVEKVIPIHEAQLLTYLRLSGFQIGLLLNFSVTLMKEGIKRYVYRASSP